MSLTDKIMSRMGYIKKIKEDDGFCEGGDVLIQDGKVVGTPYHDFSTNMRKPVLQPSEWDAAYRQISCVGTSVDLIANNIQMIEPVFWDKTKNQVAERTNDTRLKELNQLFKNPSAGVNRKKFLEKSSKDYILHGIVYYAFVFKGTKPVSIKILDAELVSATADVANNRIGSYLVNNSGSFDGNYIFNGTYYQKEDDRNYILAPYWNADPQCSYLPASILLGTGIETLMYWFGCYHNKSLLQNGARPSLIFLIKSLLNPKHREQLRQEIRVKHAGAGNAGSAIIVDGSAEKDVKQFSQNNKDMEFSEVLKAAEDAIYRRLGVNWVLGKTVQSKDYEKGMLMLFDMTICPLFQGIFNHLFDVYKYKNVGFDDLEVFYLEQNVPALRPRFLSMMKDLPTLGIFTVKERRGMYNYAPLGDYRDDELTVQSVKVTQSGMNGNNTTEFTSENNE